MPAMHISIPDFVPEFEDEGPKLRRQAGILLQDLRASCSVVVWNPRGGDAQFFRYTGEMEVSPDGYSMVQILVTAPGLDASILWLDDSEPAASDLDRAALRVLRNVQREASASRPKRRRDEGLPT
jgi:hypothetical protein